MSVIEKRGVRVAPVGASVRETAFQETPELAVWSDGRSGLTRLAVRVGRVLLEVELEPGQVDTVTAGLLDELPIPYELVDRDATASSGLVPDEDPTPDPYAWRGDAETTAVVEEAAAEWAEYVAEYALEVEADIDLGLALADHAAAADRALLSMEARAEAAAARLAMETTAEGGG